MKKVEPLTYAELTEGLYGETLSDAFNIMAKRMMSRFNEMVEEFNKVAESK